MSSEIKRRHWAYVTMLSVPKIELSLEIGNHPNLLEQLMSKPDEDFESKLALVAAYCDVIVDGSYTDREVDRLCDILTDKLRAKRSLIVVPTSARLH